jgi:hypothetical protein
VTHTVYSIQKSSYFYDTQRIKSKNSTTLKCFWTNINRPILNGLVNFETESLG